MRLSRRRPGAYLGLVPIRNKRGKLFDLAALPRLDVGVRERERAHHQNARGRLGRRKPQGRAHAAQVEPGRRRGRAATTEVDDGIDAAAEAMQLSQGQRRAGTVAHHDGDLGELAQRSEQLGSPRSDVQLRLRPRWPQSARREVRQRVEVEYDERRGLHMLAWPRAVQQAVVALRRPAPHLLGDHLAGCRVALGHGQRLEAASLPRPTITAGDLGW